MFIGVCSVPSWLPQREPLRKTFDAPETQLETLTRLSQVEELRRKRKRPDANLRKKSRPIFRMFQQA
jgi:hypothetical protein